VPTVGPIAEEFICYVFLICTRPRSISSLVFFFCFRPCGTSFMFYGYVGVRSTSYSKSSYALDILYLAFY